MIWEVVTVMELKDTVRAVRRMQNHIDAHLAEPITLAQLARAAGYSQWHSERVFREHVGKTPFEYIRALRLSKAALLLRDGRPKIVDVAFDFVFDSHEGFTKAFSRQFGISPSRYAREKPPIALFIPYPAYDRRHTQFEGEKMMEEKEGGKTKLLPVFVQVVERPARKALIRRGRRAEDYFAYCEEVGCDVWGVLTSVKEALYEPAGMWLPAKLTPAGTSKYVQGVELALDYDKPVPEGYELIELEPCSAMVFQGPPYEDDDFEEAIGIIWDFMNRFDPALYGYAWADEDAPRFQLAPMGYRGYIEARPVRLLPRG
ncbi:MAG: Right origin-binding protein [Firmicutes bacterium ADurb.Bin248]|nr:MAG: Right origin-binding protein [Firmicutes bacterium ADurb.Bin248]